MGCDLGTADEYLQILPILTYGCYVSDSYLQIPKIFLYDN